MVEAIALGQSREPTSITQAIHRREQELARIEARLKAPRPEAPRLEELRAALLQRAEDWRKTLRTEPQVARVLLRRLIGPLVLTDASEMPDFIRADAEVKPGLLDGLTPYGATLRPLDTTRVSSPTIPSWNQMRAFLEDMGRLLELGFSAA